jgi:hypothetical protein
LLLKVIYSHVETFIIINQWKYDPARKLKIECRFPQKPTEELLEKYGVKTSDPEISDSREIKRYNMLIDLSEGSKMKTTKNSVTSAGLGRCETGKGAGRNIRRGGGGKGAARMRRQLVGDSDASEDQKATVALLTGIKRQREEDISRMEGDIDAIKRLLLESQQQVAKLSAKLDQRQDSDKFTQLHAARQEPQITGLSSIYDSTVK